MAMPCAVCGASASGLDGSLVLGGGAWLVVGCDWLMRAAVCVPQKQLQMQHTTSARTGSHRANPLGYVRLQLHYSPDL